MGRKFKLLLSGILSLNQKIYRINDLEKEFGYGPLPDFTEYTIQELKNRVNTLESKKIYE